MTCSCGAKMCYLCKKPVKDYTHFYGQGGEPTATKTCPLWSDNKALHAGELAAAAEAARQRLARDQLTLDIDPIKDIARPAAPQTEDEARAELFTAWVAVNAEAGGLPNAVHRTHVARLMAKLLAKINKPGVVARKAVLADQISHRRQRVAYYRRFPQYVIPQANKVHRSPPSPNARASRLKIFLSRVSF